MTENVKLYIDEFQHAELVSAIRKMTNDGTIRTHSVNCWQWHLPCAALYAAAVIEDLVTGEITDVKEN